MDTVRQIRIWNMIRASPEMVPIVLAIGFLGYPKPEILFLFIASYGNLLVNLGLKELVFKPLYNMVGKKELPILGRGIRPIGAKACDTFLSCPITPATSYGMPSGHSQFAWAIVSYFLMRIWSDSKSVMGFDREGTIIAKTIQTVLLLLFGTTVSYSRVYVEGCHTIQQVTVGGLVGVGFGIGMYYLHKKLREDGTL